MTLDCSLCFPLSKCMKIVNKCWLNFCGDFHLNNVASTECNQHTAGSFPLRFQQQILLCHVPLVPLTLTTWVQQPLKPLSHMQPFPGMFRNTSCMKCVNGSRDQFSGKSVLPISHLKTCWQDLLHALHLVRDAVVYMEITGTLREHSVMRQKSSWM